jgi:thiamine biosynthesis lipoprotein
VNSKYQNWVIGIENPNLKKKLIKEIINVSNKGVATSGDYKNYYKENGKQYSHIINPKTGKPIQHLTKSVTVVHDNAMTADGWATALLAMGSLKGLKLSEEQNIAVLFISKQNNQLVKIKSTQFKKLIEVKN